VSDLTKELVLALLELLPEPVVVLDPSREGLPAVFANPAYLERRKESLSGLQGQSLAALLGEPADSPALASARERILRGESLPLRAQPDSPFYLAGTHLELRPLRSPAGKVQSCWCFFRTPGEKLAPTASADSAAVDVSGSHLRPVMREDRLTGLCHRDFFYDLYPRDFAIAAREGRAIAFYSVDVDALGAYNETFGRQAGDSVIRRVGRALAAGFRRAGDLITREEGGRFAALALGLDAEQARRHAETLAARVREMYIHHPHSKVARFVTVTVGVATLTPEPGQDPEALRGAATTALTGARDQGRNRIGVLALPL
jgi:diguanylate cyclase (GGDEF)-like protein